MKTLTLNQLPRIGPRKAKRQGQGIGSGKGGHTSGRGQKGQKARSKPGLLFEGTKSKKSFLKKLPLLRGKGKFKPREGSPAVVNLKSLSSLPSGSEVTGASLVKMGLTRTENVKILGEGEIKVALIVKIPTSTSAAAKIIKAGGKVVPA